MTTTLMVAAALFSWRLLRFVDEHFDGLRVGFVLQRAALLCLALVVFASPPAFSAATGQFLAEDIEQSTEWLMNIVQPILDGLGQQPPGPE